jgi:thioredoxin reductase
LQILFLSVRDTMKMTAKSYLEHARLVRERSYFAVGIFEHGITLYRQQMRALNLVHAMLMRRKAPSFKPGSKVAVIGGGAFGMTAAAAAAWVGYEVKLYESHSVLLPFQSGCDTRWINPHYYDWPSAGAESRFAALPLMNWQAGTASQVADQLVREFSTHINTTGRLQSLVAVTGLKVETERQVEREPETYVVSCRHSTGQDLWRCNAIIYATGFGVERDLGSNTAPYWRNDHFGQLNLHLDADAETTYVISGIGDSGLTDLFRLKIVNFRHERIFYELFGDAKPELIDRLRNIRADWKSHESSQQDWLFTQFEGLVVGNPADALVAEISKRLADRLRKDTVVILNGKPKRFCDALSLRRSSLSNALLTFLLFRLDAFEYRFGHLKRHTNRRWQFGIGAKSWNLPPKAQLIVRHGTERKVPLRKVGLDRANKVLTNRARLHVDTAQQIFPPGWWAQRRADTPSSAGVEFVPPITVTLASTFVNTLADILSDRLLTGSQTGNNKPQFRVTLHRVACFGEIEVFHQIAPYAGTLDQQMDGLGRIFTVQGGLYQIPLIRTRGPIGAVRWT